jgi:hypothetical protein
MGNGETMKGARPGGYEDAVVSSDPLVMFLYLLLRDHVAAGVVEQLAHESRRFHAMQFSNDFLAGYAIEIAHRLQGATPEEALATARKSLSITIVDCPMCDGRGYPIGAKAGEKCEHCNALGKVRMR